MKYNKEYWEKKAEQILIESERKFKEKNKLIIKLWDNHKNEIEQEIVKFYNKYSNDDEQVLNGFLKMLDSYDLRELKNKLKMFYKYGKKNNWQESYLNKVLSLILRNKIKIIEELKVNIEYTLQKVYKEEQEIIRKGMHEVYVGSYINNMYDIQKGLNVGTKIELPHEEKIDKEISIKWLGANYSDRIWKDKEKLIQILEQEFLKGVARGENPRKIAKNIFHKMDISKHNAERLIRTEFNRIANEASLESLKSMNNILGGGIFEKYQFLATLDKRTSEQCKDLDLKEFYIKDKMVGINFPPIHPNCRSTYTIVIDEEEVNKRISKRLDNGKVEYINSNISFREWESRFIEKY